MLVGCISAVDRPTSYFELFKAFDHRVECFERILALCLLHSFFY